MGQKGSRSTGICPQCHATSSQVKGYGVRQLSHFIVGSGTSKGIAYIEFRCGNKECMRKSFRYYGCSEGFEELSGRDRYTKSSKNLVRQKLLSQQVSYNGLRNSIQADFGNKTSLSSLHKWVQGAEVVETAIVHSLEVIHTDEKHPSKKKRKSNSKYVIASAGRVDTSSKSMVLHANLADSNGVADIEAHYYGLIAKGLDPLKVRLVVTDMLAAYVGVIVRIFPNALHQYCIFHLIQLLNKFLKESLKAHRQADFAVGERKEAYKTAFLMLKGQEQLSEEEQENVLLFCQKCPMVAAEYALKEDIRFLYANAQSLPEAYAYKDIIMETYSAWISPKMQEALQFLETHFQKSVAYLHEGYFKDKTNNDAERIMRTIKRTQQTHYFLRKQDNYIKKIKGVLGLIQVIAA